ncbi:MULTISPECIES: hypothetical protein [Streptomycetaceae]|uniref:hypothetical protein n=1 Tax=Streptomycetaceae TaxID=2062 RepID=UPI00093E8C6F|nr:hypothetical protein [Streptomyces sp. CB02056]
MPPSRADLAAKRRRARHLLRAGRSTAAVAAELHMDRRAVRQLRIDAGIPALPGGTPQRLTVEEKWRSHTRRTRGGHMTWTGEHTSAGGRVMRHSGTAYSAHRVAYRIQHGTDPEGHAKSGCGRPGCVAPEHQIDTAERRVVRTPRTVYDSAEAKLAALTRPTGDGHLDWTGPHDSGGRPLLNWRGRHCAPARPAFAQHYGRPPEGRVTAACDHPGCLAGAHLDDRLTRAEHARAYAALGL